MRTQVPFERTQGRQQPTSNFMAGQWGPTIKRSSSSGSLKNLNERPKTLGSIVANNHGVLNQALNFDEFAKIDRLQSLSMTSSADMARAQARHSFSGDVGDNIDFEEPVPEQETRQPSSRQQRRHPQPTYSRESGRDEAPASRAVQYWEGKQEAAHSRRRSAYAKREAQELRAMANNALADEALGSPNSISGHQRTTIRCHGASTAEVPRPTKPPSGPRGKPPPKRTGTLFDLFSGNNFLRSCTPALPAEQEESKTKKKSIWSYLDPNDDLYEYDEDLKSGQEPSESSEEDDDYSERQTANTSRRRRRKKNPSPGASQPPQGDSFQKAYQDLMFMNNRQHGPSTPPLYGKDRSGTPNTNRSGTPNTVGSRSSYTHTTVATTPDPERSAGRPTPSPTLSQIREDLWGNVPERRTHAHFSHGHGPSSHQSEHMRQSGFMPDPRAISSNPVHQTGPGPNLQQEFNSSKIQPSQFPLHPNHSRKDFDPFGLGRSRSQPRNTHESLGHTAATPRVSNQQGMAEFLNNHNVDNRDIQHSFPPSKKDTVPVRARSRSLGGVEQPIRSSWEEDGNLVIENRPGNNNGFFQFAPDFSMFEALRTEFVNGMGGVQPSVASNGLPTIQVREGDAGQLSNLSDSDGPSIGYERQKQEHRLDRVKQKSQRNFEILQRMEHEHNSQTIKGKSAHVQGNSRSSTTNAVSVTRTPSPAEVGRLSRRKESFDGHHMYVAYSRFSPHARDVIQLCEHQSLPPVRPRSGEILVKVLASAISTTDCDIRRGEWSSVRLNPYIIPGVAFVGVVHDTEQQKKRQSTFSNVKTGEIVMSLVKSGANARYTTVHKDHIVKVPQHLDPCMVVCLAETYLTAFQAVHHGQRGALRYRNNALRGQSILVLNGSSALGRAVIEVSLAAGADYCYALCKERQFDAISRLGGIPLQREPQKWLTLVGRQINTLVTVADNNGLYSDPINREHLKAVNEDGQVIFVGPPGMDSRTPNIFSGTASPNPSKLICKSIKSSLLDRSFCYNVHESWDSDPKLAKRDLEHLVELLEGGRVRPDVLERVPLSKVAKVHSILEKNKVSGFIVCSPWIKEHTLQHSVAGAASASVARGQQHTPQPRQYNV